MSARHAWACCALLVLTACQPAAEDTSHAAVSRAAEDVPATPANEQTIRPQESGTPIADAISRLAALPPMANTTAPEVAGYLATYFNGECSKDDALPFEQMCQHYAEDANADDPSPWPDLMLGISNRRIVSAVLRDPDANLGAVWTCDAVSGLESVRACSPSDIDANQRSAWLQRWTAYLRSAD